MSHYKPYSKYQDSGVEWLARVPEHWEVKRLRFVALIQNSNVDKKSYENQQNIVLCNYTDVYYNERITPSLEFMPSTASKAEIEKFTLLAGDVIITKDSEEADDIGIPAYVPQGLPGVVCGYHLTMLRSHGIEGEFLFRLLQSQPIKAYFLVEVSGVTRFGLGQDTIGNIAVPIPSLEEQKRVCRWIDRETTRIDALITKKTRFIELLREKRQALITHAVTKGLDPNVKMKGSGVEWLGEVPEHWAIVSIGRAVVFQRGFDLPDQSRIEGHIPVVSSGGIIAYHNESRCNGPGIVTGRYGTIGEFQYLENPFWPLNTSLFSVNCHNNHVRWLWYAMQSASHLFIVNSAKSAVPGVDRNDIHIEKCSVPPYIEQEEITIFLDRETTRIDTLISKTQHSILLLKERRAALITAAVTGQIDVRETA